MLAESLPQMHPKSPPGPISTHQRYTTTGPENRQPCVLEAPLAKGAAGSSRPERWSRESRGLLATGGTLGPDSRIPYMHHCQQRLFRRVTGKGGAYTKNKRQ